MLLTKKIKTEKSLEYKLKYKGLYISVIAVISYFNEILSGKLCIFKKKNI